MILYGKFQLDSSQYLIRIAIHANENYEHDPSTVVEIKPIFADETKIYVEVPVSQLTTGASKIFILHNDVLLPGSHTLAISNTQFVDILRVSPMVWSVKGGTLVRIVAKPLYRIKTPKKYIRLRITFVQKSDTFCESAENIFDNIVITPKSIIGSSLEFESHALPLHVIDSIVSIEISLNGGMSYSRHLNFAVIFDGQPVEAERIEPNRGSVLGGTKLKVSLPRQKYHLLSRSLK